MRPHNCTAPVNKFRACGLQTRSIAARVQDHGRNTMVAIRGISVCPIHGLIKHDDKQDIILLPITDKRLALPRTMPTKKATP